MVFEPFALSPATAWGDTTHGPTINFHKVNMKSVFTNRQINF